MKKTEIVDITKADALDFIRKKLSFKSIEADLRHVDLNLFEKEHRRFDMSGYESETGAVTIYNTAILNEFAYLGIYDYTRYLFLDFYKGNPTLYLRYWDSEENLEFELDCLGTTEIIYRIFELTIMTDKIKRRRG